MSMAHIRGDCPLNTISASTAKFTSSPASEAGLRRFVLPGGQRLFPFGQAHAPASRSVEPVTEEASTTSEISGPICSARSSESNLGLLLESRLRTGRNNSLCSGSIECSLTWSQRVTPAGRSISRLRASARRSSDSGCSGERAETSLETGDGSLEPYPSPTASNTGADDSYGKSMKLSGVAAMAPYPAPQAHDRRGGKTPEQVQAMREGTGAGVSNLNEVVMLAIYPAPRAADSEGGPEPEGATGRKLNTVAHQVAAWNAPRATDGSHGGPHQTGGSLPADAAQACEIWANPMTQDHQNSATYGGGFEKLTAQVRAFDLAGSADIDSTRTPADSMDVPTVTEKDWNTSLWVAPTTRDHKDTDGMTALRLKNSQMKDRQDQLPRQAARAFGIASLSSDSQTASSGVLAPELPRWLMGYRREMLGQSPGWASWELMQALQSGSSPSPALVESARCEASATPSSRKSPHDS